MQMHALHYAVLSGNEELVELLVSLGGDRAAGIANGDGLYPLHMACSKGMAKAAAALCKIEGVMEVPYIDHAINSQRIESVPDRTGGHRGTFCNLNHLSQSKHNAFYTLNSTLCTSRHRQ